MTYPAYTPDARCPKCGYDCVTTKHWPREERLFNHNREVCVLWEEHLHRECVRCGYGWREATIEEGARGH